MADVVKPNGKPREHKPQIKPLPVNALQFAEARFCNFFVTIDAGIAPEQLDGNLAFWANLAQRVSPLSIIHAIAKDEAWRAEFLVRDCGVGVCQVVLLPYTVMHLPPRAGTQARKTPEGYDVQRASPEEPDGFYGIRLRDGLRMTGRHAEYEAALRELLDHAIFRNDAAGAMMFPR